MFIPRKSNRKRGIHNAAWAWSPNPTNDHVVQSTFWSVVSTYNSLGSVCICSQVTYDMSHLQVRSLVLGCSGHSNNWTDLMSRTVICAEWAPRPSSAKVMVCMRRSWYNVLNMSVFSYIYAIIFKVLNTPPLICRNYMLDFVVLNRRLFIPSLAWASRYSGTYCMGICRRASWGHSYPAPMLIRQWLLLTAKRSCTWFPPEHPLPTSYHISIIGPYSCFQSDWHFHSKHCLRQCPVNSLYMVRSIHKLKEFIYSRIFIVVHRVSNVQLEKRFIHKPPKLYVEIEIKTSDSIHRPKTKGIRDVNAQWEEEFVLYVLFYPCCVAGIDGISRDGTKDNQIVRFYLKHAPTIGRDRIIGEGECIVLDLLPSSGTSPIQSISRSI